MRHHATCRVVSLSHSESFTQIAIQSWATYKLAERLCGNSGNRKSEVADMIDEASDWISVDAAVALVETTLHCHREKAVDLVRQAVNNLKVKSRTVNSTAEWVVLEVAGEEVFYSDRGQRIEVCRKDVVEFSLELQHAATRSSPRKRKSALWNNVTLAIAELRLKDATEPIVLRCRVLPGLAISAPKNRYPACHSKFSDRHRLSPARAIICVQCF
jgi:hypothetical protein